MVSLHNVHDNLSRKCVYSKLEKRGERYRGGLYATLYINRHVNMVSRHNNII